MKLNNDAWPKFDISEAEVFRNGRKEVATVCKLQFHYLIEPRGA